MIPPPPTCLPGTFLILALKVSCPRKSPTSGQKWDVGSLSVPHHSLQPISWNMDKMVSHLGHSGEGKAREWPRKPRSMPTSCSTSCHNHSDFYVKEKSASILFSSFSPANLTHQAPSLLLPWFFGYHDFVLSGIWQHLS